MFDLDKHLALHSTALKLSAKRSEVLSRNIANADTPNYKGRDIDFRKALADALDGPGPGSLRRTQAPHLTGGVPGSVGDSVDGVRIDYVDRQPLSTSLDGNTVDMSTEQAEFAKNAIRYQASLNFINSQLRGLMTAITGQ
jgi:flagellar basal-body rod protein FlgB